MATTAVKAYPEALRWFAERTLPICRKVRTERAAATRLLVPILAERDAEIAAARKEGREASVPDDSIEWLRSASKG